MQNTIGFLPRLGLSSTNARLRAGPVMGLNLPSDLLMLPIIRMDSFHEKKDQLVWSLERRLVFKWSERSMRNFQATRNHTVDHGAGA
jgi:hypothetical protein